MNLSVALCTFNGEKFLEEQLDSILSQTVLPNEIIVCDDVSEDSTFEILQKYQNQYPSIFQIHRNNENLGYVKNFEKAMVLCSGDLILLCDQDDVWKKDKIESIQNTIIENPKINVICHNIELFGESNIPEKDYWKTRNFVPNKSNIEILEMVFLVGNIFPGMSMAITKEAKQKYLPLKKLNNLIIHDFELIIQSCKDKSFYLQNEILGKYRLHENQNIGFDVSKSEKKTAINDLYNKFKNIGYNNEIATQFQLDPQLSNKYKDILKNDMRQFLKQFPLWKRLYLRLKLKYYFKLKTNP